MFSLRLFILALRVRRSGHRFETLSFTDLAVVVCDLVSFSSYLISAVMAVHTIESGFAYSLAPKRLPRDDALRISPTPAFLFARKMEATCRDGGRIISRVGNFLNNSCML